MPIVWGHKTFFKEESSFATICPHCGEKTIADVMVHKKSSHVYFIYYKTENIGKYAACRLCAGWMNIPPNITPIQIDEECILASSEHIQTSNPSIANSEIPEATNDSGISRRNLAMINSLESSLGNQNNIHSVSEGNIQGIVILFVMVAAAFLCAMYVSFNDISRIIAMSLSSIVLAFLSFKVYKLCKIMKYRAAHKEIGKRLKRFLEFTNQDTNKLIEDIGFLMSSNQSSRFSFVKIGPDYKVVIKYLGWAENKL